ncbi:MAG: HYR domain-containing protein [Lacibacter sp.]
MCAGGQNQTWETLNNTANLIQGLAPGNYTLEVYTDAQYTSCISGTHFSNNEGNNYIATFSVAAPSTFYRDADGDGFGNPAVTIQACTAPAGYVSNNTDCDDNNANVWRTGTFYVDADGDTYTVGSGVELCYGANTPAGYASVQKGNDCDDTNANVWRTGTFYVDADGDTYTVGSGVELCYGANTPAGYASVQKGNDCDDTNANVWRTGTFYVDADGDGYTVGSGVELCYGANTPAGYATVQNGNDCDDTNDSVWRTGTFYVDADGDTYTVGSGVELCYGANTPAGYATVQKGNDCDDTNANVWRTGNFYPDADGDGFGAGSLETVCYGSETVPAGYSTNNTDCAPADATKWRSANLYIDNDGDGYDAGQQVVCYGASIPAGFKETTNGPDCNDNDATVHALPVVAPITAATNEVCANTTLQLSNATPGGIWSSSNPVASVNAGGLVTGLAAGTSTISYAVTNSCGTTTQNFVVTVNPAITLTTQVTDVSCVGGTDGKVVLNVSGGTLATTLVNAPAITQDFNTLASSGTSSILPAGWFFTETGAGANTLYNTGTGSNNAGDTYSFGADGSTDRALGGLRSGAVVPTIGAEFTNTTGKTVKQITISYTGEQWRLGNTGREDRLDFQYSTNATSLTTGSWTDVNQLDFIAPVTTGSARPLDGNASANRTAISYTITGLNLAPNAKFWIRWNDFDATGADDGLAVDDFSLTMAYDETDYRYQWSNGATTKDLNNVAAGIYNVTVTDSKGCQATTSATVGSPAPITGSAAVTSNYNGSQLSCATASDGQITVTASGGTGALQYSINGGSSYQSGNVFSSLGAGTYEVRVKDANGCVFNAGSVTLSAPAAISGSAAVSSNYNGAQLSCATATDGQITVTASGGTGTLQYSINGGSSYQTANVFSNLAANTYLVRVKDANGCEFNAGSVTITAPPALSLSTTVTDVTCPEGTDGKVVLNVNGGTLATTLVNAPAITQDFNTLASSGTSSILPAGWFFTETGTGANTLYNTGTGSNNAGDTYSFGADGSTDRALGGLRSGAVVPTIGAEFTNTTGKTVKQITISYTGEQWRLGNTGREDRLDFQYSTNATSLTTGSWTDVNQLDFIAPVTTGSARPLDGNASANRTAISYTITGLNLAPNAKFWIRWNDFDATGADDGLAVDDFSLTMAYDETDYRYQWSNGATTKDLNNVAAGTYSVTVTDANGCQASTSVTVNQNDPFAPTAVCKNIEVELDASGTATITPAMVDNGSSDNCGIVEYSLSKTTFTCADLGPQQVTFTVKDAGGKTASCVATVTVKDVTAPVLTPANNQNVNLDAGCEITVPDVRGTATDNCAGTVITQLPAAGSKVPAAHNGTISVTVTATDAAGNKDEKTVVLTAKDVTAPVLTVPSGQNVNLGADCKITIPDLVAASSATDNCGFTITQSPVAGTIVSAAHNGTINVTVTATDAAGNKDEKTVVLTAKDVTAPVLTVPSGQNVNLGVDCKITIPDLVAGSSATDNCGFTITQNPVAGTIVSAAHNGTINVTVTATDAAGNTDVKTVVLTAKDVTPPSITCPPSQTFASDAGTETKTLTAAQIGTPTVNDNCGATFSWSRSDGAASLTAPFNFGTTTITWTATDAAGNSTSCTQTISVDQVTTETTVSVSPVTAQYSDRVSFTATVSPFNVSGAGAVGGTVTFRIGTQVMGTAPVINGTATLANVALLETAPAGQLAPGNRQVTATFAGTNPNYIVNNPAAATLVITQEDARVEYIGMESQATPSVSSSTATVQLTATVADITAITGDPAFDAFAGDIRNARVRFVNRDNNSAISGWLTPSLINGDTKVGVVNFAWPVNIGSSDAQSFTVGIEVEGYYTRNDAEDNVVITVYKPIGDFVAGGGYIRVTNSAGSLAATGGTKMNFGLNVKFNKKGTNLQGGVNMIFRRNVNGTIRTYQIRSNSMTSLGVSGTTNDRIAQFLSKANLTDVTNPLAPVSLGGNLDLRVSLRDRGEPGVNDEIGVTLMNNSGTLLFSSNWSTTATVRTVLGGGNIYINSANFGSTAGAREADPAAHMPAFNANCFDVQVLGNPTQHQFGLRVISSDVNSKITVRITDVNGRVVEVQQNLYSGQLLQLGGNYAPGVYFAEAIQGTERKVLRLVKLN